MTSFQLSNNDARLAYLAMQYHLARPGSELDPETKQPSEQGLAGVARALEPQLEKAVATIELSDYQRQRLVSAVAGSMNELKTYPLLVGGGQTTMPVFYRTLASLFPEVREEPEEASQLAAHLMALRRRLEHAPAEASAAPQRRPWWRFWQGGGA